MKSLKNVDGEIFELIQKEQTRQQEHLELIASENYVSKAVLQAQGSILTNKYAEGYPYRFSKKTGELNYKLYGRYYGGCEYIDQIEKLAIERAKTLFGCPHANVQPHSGSQANMAAYLALLDYGDTILSLELSHGGHLTHGHPLNFSGVSYRVIHYGVEKQSCRFDYDKIEQLAVESKPKLIVTGASAYPRIIDFERFSHIAKKVGAYLMVDMAHIAGLVAAGLHPSPVPFADIVTTTTHKTLRGPRAGLILCKNKFAKAVDGKVFPGVQGGPLEHVIAAKAVAFGEALKQDFTTYQKQVVKNAKSLAVALAKEGFSILTGGTDNHLLLVNLNVPTCSHISGKQLETSLNLAGITVNKNTIPFDPRPPFVTSGIRIGTPAVTTRGMGEGEMVQIASLIAEVFNNIENEDVLKKVKAKVKKLCDRFPV